MIREGRRKVDTWPYGVCIGRGFTGGTVTQLHNLATILDAKYNTNYWRSTGLVVVPGIDFLKYVKGSGKHENRALIQNRIQAHNQAGVRTSASLSNSERYL